MPLYDVIVTRDATMSKVVRVRADNPEQADAKALKAAGPRGENLNGWTLDEDNMNRVYVGAPGDAERLEGNLIHKGDLVRLRKSASLKELGIQPSPDQQDILAGVMRVERADTMPLDEHPDHQAVFIDGLPWIFGGNVLERVD